MPSSRHPKGRPPPRPADRGRADDAERAVAARDLTFVEGALPVLQAAVRGWFRPEVDGWEHVPDTGPVLLVGNHSGGNATPDSVVFVLSFLERFGIDRPLHWLGHSLLMSVPGLGDLLRRCGVLVASRRSIGAALDAGAAVVVYPGGERELHRSWMDRDQVKFFGRTGFVEVARHHGVPVTPVVAHGAHNTYLPITDGHLVARALRLDRLARMKVLPVSLAAPWGINVGFWLPHLPLPAKIRIRVLEPIDVTQFDTDEAAYHAVTSAMQRCLDELAGN